jgi:Putative peptidoglycan binding domain
MFADRSRDDRSAARRLHQRVADYRACKFESTPQQVAAHRIGFRSSRRYLGHHSPPILDRGRDLEPVVHNAFVAEPPQASRESPSKAGAKGNSSAAPQNPADAQWPRNGESRSWNMKKLKLLSLVGITSIALANAGWAAGHGGGGGGFGGGGFSSGGHAGGGGGGARASGGHFGGGAGFRSRGPGFSGRPFNGRMGQIVERHDANWHGDWDRRHAHFFRNRFFVFDDGFWFGFYPWDYYYPYDDQDYYGYDESTDPYSVSTVSAVQSDLAKQGYYRGVIDGIYGPQTRMAITRYQSNHRLQVTGSLTAATLQSLGLPQPMGS